MPYNKAERIHQQHNKARFTDTGVTLRSKKAARRSPNLNNIPKQES